MCEEEDRKQTFKDS